MHTRNLDAYTKLGFLLLCLICERVCACARAMRDASDRRGQTSVCVCNGRPLRVCELCCGTSVYILVSGGHDGVLCWWRLLCRVVSCVNKQQQKTTPCCSDSTASMCAWKLRESDRVWNSTSGKRCACMTSSDTRIPKHHQCRRSVRIERVHSCVYVYYTTLGRSVIQTRKSRAVKFIGTLSHKRTRMQTKTRHINISYMEQ